MPVCVLLRQRALNKRLALGTEQGLAEKKLSPVYSVLVYQVYASIMLLLAVRYWYEYSVLLRVRVRQSALNKRLALEPREGHEKNLSPVYSVLVRVYTYASINLLLAVRYWYTLCIIRVSNTYLPDSYEYRLDIVYSERIIRAIRQHHTARR